MIRYSCCVTGHREITDEKLELVKQRLREEVEQAVEDGYTIFYSGFADGIDLIFADIVTELKQKNKKLRLIAALPYPDREQQLNRNEYSRKLLAACDSVQAHSPVYKDDCYKVRNEYMVEESYRCIAVHDGRPKGGTVNTMRYAQGLERDLRVISI